MNLQQLKNVIEYAIEQADASGIEVIDGIEDQKQQVKTLEQMLLEVNQLDERLKAAKLDEIFDGSCYVVSISDIIDAVNYAAYDIYGKLQRNSTTRISTDEFIAECRRTLTLDGFTDEMIREGYDFVSDLWYDNESVGNNKPDGTFDTGSEMHSILD
jgi:hypothetical protein